jgi:flagellar protein FlgJ
MTAPTNNATFYADFKSLSALKLEAKNDSQKALRGAAQQFESLFINMMLKNMREATASVRDSADGSNDMNLYQGMFDEQIATQMSKGKGLGLADLLVQQLNRSGMVKGAPSEKGSAVQSPANTKSIANPVTERSHNSHSVTPAASNSVVRGKSVTTASSAVATEKATPRFSSPADFVEKMWPYAQQAAQKLGVDPSTLIAHAALETGWGKHIPCHDDGSSSFNLFGIKAGTSWNGNSIGAQTLEFDQGVAVKKVERFKSYDSPEQCFADYAALLASHPRYGETLNAGSNAAKFAHALQKGGYATDPQYANKLKAVARNVMSLINDVLGNASTQYASRAQASNSSAVT